jgi:hypothetical protein
MEGLNFRQANSPLSVSDCVRLTNRLNAPPRARTWKWFRVRRPRQAPGDGGAIVHAQFKISARIS